MNCWICGQVATTREHLFKASNIRKLYPVLTQKAPLYFNNFSQDPRRNAKLSSTKSGLLTAKTMLCANCNNVRSQPYDRAWDGLFDLIIKHWEGINTTKTIYLKRAFGTSRRSGAINMALYFHKMLGTVLLDAGQIPPHVALAKKLSNAILAGKPLDSLNLSVFRTASLYGNSVCGIGHASVIYDRLSWTIARVEWHYLCGNFGVKLVYCDSLAPISQRAWRPNGTQHVIHLLP